MTDTTSGPAAQLPALPDLRTRLMRRFVSAGFWPRLRLGRLGYWLWQRYGALGTCDVCRAPTWTPVAFYVQREVGRTGHYFCEKCGPPMLDVASALGERVTL